MQTTPASWSIFARS